MIKSTKPKYSYNYFALGCPIIQYPQDMIAIQELIWEVKPDLIIETGIAHGGSLIMSASMLALLDMCEAIELSKSFNCSRFELLIFSKVKGSIALLNLPSLNI